MYLTAHVLQEYDTDDSSDENQSEISDGNSDSETSETEIEHKAKSKTQSRTRLKSKTSKKKIEKDSLEESSDQMIKDLEQRFSRMELLINEKTKNQGVTQGTRSCYNCKQLGHSAKECQAKCKICSGELAPENHPFFECPKYVPRRSWKTEKSLLMNDKENDDNHMYTVISSAMDQESHFGDDEFLEDTFMAKRLRSGREIETHDENRKVKVTTANDTGIHPGFMVDKNIVKVAKPTKSLAKEPITVNDIVNRPVMQLSIAQMADISPSFRTEMKKSLTKAHSKLRRTKIQQTTNVAYKIDYSDQNNQGKAKGAPRLRVKLNGVPVEAILDGGAGSCLISLQLINQLGINSLDKSNTTHALADGSRSRAIGVARGLALTFGDGIATRAMIDATVFDQDDYPLLIGRYLLEALKIGTDWERNFWYIKTPSGVTPLKVGYEYDNWTTDQVEEESDTEETSYLVIPVDDSNDENVEEPCMLDTENKSEENCTPTSREELMEELEKSVASNALLDPSQKLALTELLKSKIQAFGKTYGDLTQTDLVELHINTGDAVPISKKPNQWISHSERDMLKREIETMVQQGLLVPSQHSRGSLGGWSFPCMYVSKKTGEKRLVTQFQDLNAVTTNDPWPMPLLTDILEAFEGAQLFSALDLLKGFNQIKVAEHSREKLTIATPWGCYSYVVMPFGIKNGPATFSRAIFLALEKFMPEFVMAYMDDVTIFSSDFDKHLHHLDRVLTRLIDVKFKLKPSKCSFAQKEISLLGFLVSAKGVSPHPAKIQKIQDFPKPRNTRDVRAFVNLAGFFRRHILLFSEVAAPLTVTIS